MDNKGRLAIGIFGTALLILVKYLPMLHDKTYSAMLAGGHSHNQTHWAKSLRFS